MSSTTNAKDGGQHADCLRLNCDEQIQYRCVGLIQGAMEHYATELAGGVETAHEDTEVEDSDGDEEEKSNEAKTTTADNKKGEL
jgi:hypothetical protein